MKITIYSFLVIVSTAITLFFIFYKPESDVEKLITDWNNKNIIIPDSQIVCKGNDSTLLTTLPSHRMYVIIDTLGCTSCSMQIDEWKFFLKESIEQKSLDYSLIYVVNKRNAIKVKNILRSHGLSEAMVMVVPSGFYTANNIPDEWQYRTFLTDSENNVILTGSPLYSEGLRELFLEQLCTSRYH